MNLLKKTGYLEQDFRLFHIKDQTKREFSYHYHDFHKVIIFLSGKAAYHIEGKSYYLKPWDILLVNRHAIHKPEIDFSVPYERFVLWIRDDIKSTELLRCFQKAIDRSYNLIRLDSDTQEKLKQLLYELEAALKDEKIWQRSAWLSSFYPVHGLCKPHFSGKAVHLRHSLLQQ